MIDFVPRGSGLGWRTVSAGELAPWLLLALLVVLFGVGFAWLSVLRHEAFQSHAFDLGNMDQAVWNTLHGSVLRFTDMQLPAGKPCCHEPPVLTNRLAIHVEPLLVPISLLYVLHSGPEMLLVLQALVVASGAVPAYLLARDLLGRQWLSLVFPAAYLLHPSLQNALLDDFHPVTMSAAFLLWAMYFLRVDWTPGFWAMGVVAAATKEEVGLLVALLGLPLMLRHRIQGTIALLGGIAWFVIAVELIIPHYNPGGESPYLDRYSYLGHGFRGVILGILGHPAVVWQTLTSGPRLSYLNALLDPLAFISILGLPILLLATPALLVNMLSEEPTMFSGFYQYSAEVVPYLVASAVVGVFAAGRAARRARAGRWVVPVLCILVIAASLAATRRYGFSPLAEGYVVPSAGRHQLLESRLLRLIPPGAAVAAADEIEPHLSDRRTIYLLPTTRPANGPPAQFVVLDASIPSVPITPDQLHLSALRALAHGYGVVTAKDGVLLLRRGAPTRRIPTAFFRFAFTRGARTPETASWGPLQLVGVTIHPSYGWVNRARPAVEVETYWRATRRLPAGTRIRLFVSPKYSRSAPPLRRWGSIDDSPTWDWLPLEHWPVGRTVHAALLPSVLPTQSSGTVSLAIGVSGLGAIRHILTAQRIRGNDQAVLLGTIEVRS